MDAVKLLKDYVCDSRGNPKRGAIARVAEHLECSYSTVRNWILGDRFGLFYQPRKAMAAKIEDMVKGKKDISAHRTGPGKIKSKCNKRAKCNNFSELKETRLQADITDAECARK